MKHVELNRSLRWLLSCINCPAWAWDPAQKEAAADCYESASAELDAIEGNDDTPERPAAMPGDFQLSEPLEDWLRQRGWVAPDAAKRATTAHTALADQYHEIMLAANKYWPIWSKNMDHTKETYGGRLAATIAMLGEVKPAQTQGEDWAAVTMQIGAFKPNWFDSNSSRPMRLQAADAIHDIGARGISGLTVSVDNDRVVWLNFRSNSGRHALLNFDEIASHPNVPAARGALSDWANDRIREAKP